MCRGSNPKCFLKTMPATHDDPTFSVTPHQRWRKNDASRLPPIASTSARFEWTTVFLSTMSMGLENSRSRGRQKYKNHEGVDKVVLAITAHCAAHPQAQGSEAAAPFLNPWHLNACRPTTLGGMRPIHFVASFFWSHPLPGRTLASFSGGDAMNNPIKYLLALSLATAPLWASADSWKDESGHGKRHGGGREIKEAYWDGHCKVERKFDKSGEYKEERKCRAPKYGHQGPAPVYIPAPGPHPHGGPGIVIHGTVRIP